MIYFKQAIEMLKQNKFISTIAIVGTALAIMMIMTIIVSDEIKNISVAPEVNRDRTLYINRCVQEDTIQGGTSSSPVTSNIIKQYLLDMKTPEYVSAVDFNTYAPPALVSKWGDDHRLNATVRKTDDAYWNLYSFHFLEGKPFSKETFESGVKEAVVSETLAKKLFKGEEVVGQTMEIDQVAYRVTGVVKDISPVFKLASGDAWIPYSSLKTYGEMNFSSSNVYTILLLARSKKDFEAIAEEIRGIEKRYGIDHEGKVLTLRGPEDHNTFTMNLWGNTNEQLQENKKTNNRRMVFILLVLLLVPAINLSGLSFSRIKKRTEEIGVRKAFGAKRHTILIQVLMENLITSFLGGIIGLLLSYVIVFQMRHWLLGIPADSPIPIGTLISFPVFLSVFVVCLLVNLLSAGIPAYKASRMTIINSLHQNDR